LSRKILSGNTYVLKKLNKIKCLSKNKFLVATKNFGIQNLFWINQQRIIVFVGSKFHKLYFIYNFVPKNANG